MMKAVFALAIMLIGSVAQAQAQAQTSAQAQTPAQTQSAPAWEGYWAENPAWCARAGQPGEQTPDWYGRDGLFGLEWSCDVTASRATGVGQSWVMQLACLEMGDSYQEAAIWMVTPQDRLRILTAEGQLLESTRCADPGAADAPARLACESNGGNYQIAGLLQQHVCLKPTPDGGKSCSKASDCSGFCLADSRTCAAVRPMFGCHEILAEDGTTVGLCVD